MFATLFSTISFSNVAQAQPLSMDYEDRSKISFELQTLGYDYSRLVAPSIHEDYIPLSGPSHRLVTDFEADNVTINNQNLVVENGEPIHVGTAKFTNYTDSPQKFNSQEYSQTFTHSIANTTSHTLKVGAESKGSIQVPVIGYDLTLKVEYDFSKANTETETKAETFIMKSQTVEVKPMQSIKVVAKLERAKIRTDLTLGVDLFAKVPMAQSKSSPKEYYAMSVGNFIKAYKRNQRLGVLPPDEISPKFEFVNRFKGPSELYSHYTGGKSNVVADIGTNLVVSFYDITEGEDNPKLIKSTSSKTELAN